MEPTDRPRETGQTLDLAITLPLLRTLLDYWIELRGARPMPTRDQFDPSRIPSCLPNLWICRRGEDSDFTCVLAGEEIQLACGHTIMNRPLADFLGDEYRSTVKGRLNRVLDTPAVLHAVFGIGNQPENVERLCLPIADSAGRPVQVLGGSVYRFDRQLRSDPEVLQAAKSAAFYHTRDLVPLS